MSLHIEALKASASFNFIEESFYTFFVKEFGEINAKDIVKKLNGSKTALRFLSESSLRGVRPMAKNYIEVINSSTSFLFAKSEKIALAAILLLRRWCDDVGEKLGLSNDLYLNKVFFEILTICDGFKTHISGNPNFFDRYFSFLEEILQIDNEENEFDSSNTDLDNFSDSRTESKKVPLIPENLKKHFNSLTVREAIFTGRLSNIGYHGFYLLYGNEVVGGKSNEYYFPLDDYAVRISKKVGEKLKICGDDPDFMYNAFFMTSNDHYEFGTSNESWFYLYHPEIDQEDNISKDNNDFVDDLPF